MALNPTLVWLLIGTVLCLIELVVPTAFIAAVLGLSALITAAVSSVLPLGLQIAVWMIVSLALVLLSRRLVRRKAATRLDAVEATTIAEILPGKTGRVRYEGNSWSARCEDHTLTIGANQKVYVVARRGTTLIVVPEHLLHS